MRSGLLTCGIVGAYGWTNERTLSSMLEWIEHRGPDEEGTYVDAASATTLRDGHRRGERSDGRTLWQILTYVAWYHTFIDEGTSILESPTGTARRVATHK